MISFPKKQGVSRHSLVYESSSSSPKTITATKPTINPPASASTTKPVPPYKKPVPVPSPLVKQFDPNHTFVVPKPIVAPEPVVAPKLAVAPKNKSYVGGFTEQDHSTQPRVLKTLEPNSVPIKQNNKYAVINHNLTPNTKFSKIVPSTVRLV